MGWFVEWWQELGLIGQVLACLAIPASIILLLQAILALIGVGSGVEGGGIETGGAEVGTGGFETDGIEIDGDVDFDSSDYVEPPSFSKDAIRIITIRGIVAFLAIGGWAGLVASTGGLKSVWVVLIAVFSGAAAMILAALAINFMLNMQSSGNIDLKYALSQTAEVYITVPPSRTNTGKVMILLQERLVEVEAVTDSTEAIKPATIVEVSGLAGKDRLVVRRIQEDM